jgi:hypothetical protein
MPFKTVPFGAEEGFLCVEGVVGVVVVVVVVSIMFVFFILIN